MKTLVRFAFWVFVALTVTALGSPVTAAFWWWAGAILAGLLWLAVGVDFGEVRDED